MVRRRLEETFAWVNSVGLDPLRSDLFPGRALGPCLSHDSGAAFQFLLAGLVACAYTTMHVGCVSVRGATQSRSAG